MATMSDGSVNNNQTRDLDESAAGTSTSRNRRSSAADAARERLSRNSGEFAKNREAIK